MCVIVHQPSGETLYRKEAVKLWKQNPDGGGFAYPHGERIVRYRSLNFKDWWRHYSSAVKAHPDVPFLIHMRIATHGEVCEDNTHPFKVDEHTVMAHNGVIWDCLPNKFDDRSDTRVFVEDVLPRLPEGWLDDEYLPIMVEQFVDSKLMFLTVDPDLKYSVYRFGKWEKYRTLFMSNTYGLYPKASPVTYRQGTDWWPKSTPTTSRFLIPDDDDGWVKAPEDEDEYDEWINRLIEEYEDREFHHTTEDIT